MSRVLMNFDRYTGFWWVLHRSRLQDHHWNKRVFREERAQAQTREAARLANQQQEADRREQYRHIVRETIKSCWLKQQNAPPPNP
jgi:hypothetical protein